MKQWDTKKQFKPRYGFVAKIVFTGFWLAIVQPNWRAAFLLFWEGVCVMAGHLFGILLGVGQLVLHVVNPDSAVSRPDVIFGGFFSLLMFWGVSRARAMP